MASAEQTDEAGDSSESSDLWRVCASRIQETGWVRARVALEAPKLGALIAWSAVGARGKWPEPIALR